jgi:hypothetical protein
VYDQINGNFRALSFDLSDFLILVGGDDNVLFPANFLEEAFGTIMLFDLHDERHLTAQFEQLLE